MAHSKVRRPLSIASAQPRCTPYDIAANAAAHAEIVRKVDARVVVFPELSLTGYELDAPVVEPDDPRLAPVIDACSAADSIALIGAPVASEAGDHIAMLAVEQSGVTVAYKKMWLGEAEAERFTPGLAPMVLEIDRWRLGLAICKDTGVPQHSANTAALGMDVYIAGVLDSADEASIQDERARRVAADHGVWVVVASFAGSTGGGYHTAAAHSRIWSPGGEIIASAGDETDGIARTVLAMD